MVHALQRAGRHLRSRGVLVLLQPHQWKRPRIAIAAGSERQSVTILLNPEFQPRIEAANAAIQTVIDQRLFAAMGRSDHEFRVRLANPHQLWRYLHIGVRPPRFPMGGRRRFDQMWKRRRAGTQIEVIESLTVIGLRRRG